MFKSHWLILILIFAGWVFPAYSQECAFSHGIWATGTPDDRIIFYLDDEGSPTSRHNVFFERWTDNKLIARMYGYMTSSMGAPVEAVIIEKSYHPYIRGERGSFSDNSLLSVIVERLPPGEELPQYLTFAGLNQALWNAGSDHVEFFEPTEDPDHVFAGPNAFEFLACRTHPVDVVSREAWTISGPEEDSAGHYCVAVSPRQLVLRLNRDNKGFGIMATQLDGIAINTEDGVARALIQVDDSYTAWIPASVIETQIPNTTTATASNVFAWSTDPHLYDAIKAGRRLYMKVGSDVEFDTDLGSQPGALIGYALDGSAKAIAKLESCTAGAETKK